MTKVIGNYDDRDVSLLAVDQYFRQVRRTQFSTREEDRALLARVVAGRGADGSFSADAVAARDRLIEAYQGWVIRLASRLVRHCRVLERMDLIQEGNIGLMQAIASYDPALVHSVPGWFCEYIHHAMSRAMIEQDTAVRLTQRNRTELIVLRQTEERLCETLRREPTVAELAAALRMSQARVWDLQRLRHWQRVESLQGLLAEEEMEEDRYDFVSLFEQFVQESSWKSERVRQAVAEALTKRQQEVIRSRFGMDEQDGRALLQVETATALGLRAASIRRIEQAAYQRLAEVLPQQVGIVVETRPAVLVCDWCGREFPPRFGTRRDNYCHDRCRGAARRARESRSGEVA